MSHLPDSQKLCGMLFSVTKLEGEGRGEEGGGGGGKMTEVLWPEGLAPGGNSLIKANGSVLLE